MPLTSSYKTSYTPSIEAVQEFSFQKNAVDAEYGYSSGGIVIVNMKSGTNDFHGSGYYHNRNPKLNAFGDPTLVRTAGADETIFRGTDLKMYGGTIGGPIIKNKPTVCTSSGMTTGPSRSRSLCRRSWNGRAISDKADWVTSHLRLGRPALARSTTRSLDRIERRAHANQRRRVRQADYHSDRTLRSDGGQAAG